MNVQTLGGRPWLRRRLARLDRRSANALGFAACAVMMAGALFVQYVLGDQPCHLCILQRVAVIAVGLLFLAAAVHGPGRRGARVYALLIGIAGGAGLVVAARNIYVQLQPPGAVPACSADLNVLVEMMPLHQALATVFMAGGDCQQVVSFLGVPLPVWVIVGLSALMAWAYAWNVAARTPGTEIVRFGR
jgi:disulfide bond formation protein DsbB